MTELYSSSPGTLNWHQGLDIAIRAFALIKDKAPEAQFHIYGEGPCRSLFIQLVKDLGLQDQVLFKGVMSVRKIATIMEGADVGIVPKRKMASGMEPSAPRSWNSWRWEFQL